MKFLADECCDTGLVQQLRNFGHDVVYIQETASGSSDNQVLKQAFTEKRILITEDKDFGELVYRLKKPVFGIILLRFNPLKRTEKIDRIKELLDHYSSKLNGHFTVVDIEKFRIRPLQ